MWDNIAVILLCLFVASVAAYLSTRTDDTTRTALKIRERGE